MRRSYRFELFKLRRRGILAASGLVGALALLATVITFVSADSATLTQLGRPEGVAHGFAGGASLIGLLVFVVVTGSITAEYGQGTLRVLLVEQPRRRALLVGKLLALLTVVTVALFAALAVSVVAAVVAAQVRGVDTASWWTLNGLGEAGTVYLNACLSNVLFSVAATALAVLLRSTGVALTVGIAWLGPLEQILKQHWAMATRVFPGLVFDVVAQGGSHDAPYGTALLTGALYAALAISVALVIFRRRDVTV